MIKILKRNIFIIIIFIIILICTIYFVINKHTSPILMINGKILSCSENNIYLDGAVQNPGIYKCEQSTILKDVINSAKGLNEKADISQIDFNLIVKSGEKIIIPYIKESENVENAKKESNFVININVANKVELMKLEGIGEKTANKIIEYRENNKFKCIDEIMNVDGIGENKFSNIKDNIIVE